MTLIAEGVEGGQCNLDMPQADIWISCQAWQDIQASGALTQGPKCWIIAGVSVRSDRDWNGIDCTVDPTNLSGSLNS